MYRVWAEEESSEILTLSINGAAGLKFDRKQYILNLMEFNCKP